MQIIKKIKKTTLILAVLLFSTGILKAQYTDALGTFTPYSLFGIGEIERQGTALNRGMGGIGVGVRDNRFINYLNPASITERDTLSFMLDFGLASKNFYNSDGKTKSAYNTFNMQNFIISMPIYKKSAFIVGFMPYSNIGYKFESTEKDDKLVAEYGDIRYQKYGDGGINQFFVGAAMNPFKNLSIGVEGIYYFGALNRFNDVVFKSTSLSRNVLTGWDYYINSFSAKLGAQYFTKVGKDLTLTLGATYRIKTNLKGELSKYAYAESSTSVRDTILNQKLGGAKLTLPAEFAGGFSIRKKDKWMVGFDYMRQNWNEKNYSDLIGDGDYSPVAANYYKAGFEITPNKYDIRYYMKRVTYRMGAYYEQSYLNIKGNQVSAYGVTLGASLPINKWYNAVNLAVDFGQRGSRKNNMVKETYVQFIINLSLHDIWFIKRKFD